MTIRTMTAAMLAGAMLAAWPTGATAGEREDFLACDGQQWPGRDGNGLRDRGVTNAFGRYEDLPDLHLAACTRALASKRLTDAMPLRRANLLRIRAVAHARKKAYDAALADLDAALALAGPFRSDRHYARSAIAAMELHRAAVLVALGRGAEAIAPATAARDLRPYSSATQRAAAIILDAARPLGTDIRADFAAVSRLEGDADRLMLRLAQHGRFADIVALADADGRTDWIATDHAPGALGTSYLLSGEMAQVERLLLAAYARAATGDAAGALRDLEGARLLRADGPATDDARRAAWAERMARTRDGFDASARVIEARARLASGTVPPVLGDLVAGRLPKNALTHDLLGAIIARDGDATGALTAARDSMAQAVEADRRDAAMRLGLAAASTDADVGAAPVVYKKAGTDVASALLGTVFSLGLNLLSGVEKTSGWSDVDHGDGTVTVRYNGSIAHIDHLSELVLLRAAEIARERGRPAIALATRDGVLFDVPATETANRGIVGTARFRLVEADAPRAIPAEAVIAELAPLYAAPPRPARR